MQTTVNERLKFLTEYFQLSARKFSRAIGVPENNTQNYLPPKTTDPGARYLERILLHFESVNAHWLLTGDGPAFEEPAPEDAAEPATTYQRVRTNTGNMVGTNHGTTTQTQGPASNCEEKLAAANELILQLKSQLTDKERIIQFLEKR